MKLTHLLFAALCFSHSSIAGPVPDPDTLEWPQAPPQKRTKHLRPYVEKRQQFEQGQPISADGKGAPIIGQSDPQQYSFVGHTGSRL